ncbi:MULTISPECIES: hypothetical protein [unclassified Gilliamella]|uniref:hypothetical protein n=1 Tax=unclassified Gilliamella TaxID=2685620 RepID=UPI0011798D20|nr:MULTISPECIES: hypothetical protein [unclassified Gilliamella]
MHGLPSRSSWCFQSAGRAHHRRSRRVQYGLAVRYALRSDDVRHSCSAIVRPTDRTHRQPAKDNQ